jgi:hypothetical protein
MSSNESTKLRDQACDLAATNLVQAVAIAHRIPDPWFACQAFAWCARFAPESESSALIDEAFRQADAGKDVYQQVAVTAWPLRALVELGLHARAQSEFERITILAPQVEPPSSRADACLHLFEALAVGASDLARQAFDTLLIASQPADHWRQQRAVREAIITAITLKLVKAEDALEGVPMERLRKQIADRLARGETLQPRPFFWSRGQTVGTY